jgi:hypothetical protein
MASFNNAAEENIQMIIRHVDSLEDLFNLSLVCSRLYRSIDYPKRSKYHRVRVTTSAESLTRAYDILIDIIKYPHLRSYARELEVDPDRVTPFLDGDPDFPPEEAQQILADPDADLIRSAISATGICNGRRLAWSSSITKEERLVMSVLVCKAEHR